MKVLQLSLGFPDFERNTKEVQAAIDELASNPESGTRGAVFTRPEVVEFILDLVGYTKDRPLYNMRLLEPSFGGGDFLVAIVKRLLESWHSRKIDGDVLAELSNSIRAVELHYDTFHKTYTEIVKLLRSSGIADHKTIDLANHWLSQGDFLLIPLEDKFDFVALLGSR